MAAVLMLPECAAAAEDVVASECTTAAAAARSVQQVCGGTPAEKALVTALLTQNAADSKPLHDRWPSSGYEPR